MIISRDLYLNKLIRLKGDGLIKVITGIRRCGKSFLLKDLFYKYLLDSGVKSDHIIYIPFDDRTNIKLRDCDEALSFIKSQIIDDNIYYILLDEVQLIEDNKDKTNKYAFYDVMNSLLHLGNCDIYATGSNSKFLSKDIATTFRGRSEEVKMHPLRFKEYFSVSDLSKEDALREYMTYGGLPLVLAHENVKDKTDYLEDVLKLIYKKDLEERYQIRGNVEFDEVFDVVSSQIGSYNSVLSLKNTFKSVKNKDLSEKTLNTYVNCLMDAFLIKKVLKYDIKGKKYINSLSKYYFEDLGIRNTKINFRQNEYTHLLENVVYNELIIRGYNVDVGNVSIREKEKKDDDTYISKKKSLEIDFVCNFASERYYIQVAYSLSDEDKIKQEKRPLLNVKESFKKIIITNENISSHRDDNGIVILNIFDFLLNDNSLEMF